MTVLLIALGFFVLSWLVHLAWWRCALPTHHSKALIGVFTGVPILTVAVLGLTDRLAIVSPTGWAAIAFFHAGATLCYLITYAGVEETSPSLLIIRTLEKSGNRGATDEELYASVASARFMPPRIESLARDGFVTREAGMIRLTERGRSAALLARRVSTFFNLGTGA